jgi:hypothetical protein
MTNYQETTLSVYDTYDLTANMVDTVWKIKPVSNLSSILFYAEKKHASKVKHEIIPRFIITEDNVQNIDTRLKLENILSKYSIAIDDYRFTVEEDNSVTVYGTGIKLYRKEPHPKTNKRYLEKR